MDQKAGAQRLHPDAWGPIDGGSRPKPYGITTALDLAVGVYGLRTTVLVALVALVALGAVGLFVVDAGETSPDPVLFDDIVTMGAPSEVEFELAETGADVPRVQVFYSQYRYVVGYYGVEGFVSDLREPAHEQRFGYPLSVYVSDFSGTDPDLTEEGYLQPTGTVTWAEADAVVYVVGGDARTPVGETVVPFSDPADAEAFADAHGGELLSWAELLEEPIEHDDAATVRQRVDEQAAAADALVEATDDRRDRPVSVVVGAEGPPDGAETTDDVETAATIAEGLEAAPSGTTVLVAEGTYRERVEIDRPVTLAGDGAVTMDGEGDGTVIELTGDAAAVTGVSIVGVGDQVRIDHEELDEEDIEADEWDTQMELGYGHTDAGVTAAAADDVLIEDVDVETPANGVLLRDAEDAVVREVTVEGAGYWRDGYMGVTVMRSDGVIEGSTFVGGRDGVYMHRGDGIVIRDSVFEEGRYGIHFMYTDDALIADNRISEQRDYGIIVMTDPERNAIVGNVVHDAVGGIGTGGTDTYVADNVLYRLDEGLTTGTVNSVYEGNAIVDNEQGLRTTTILPSSQVSANDFAGNEDHAISPTGPLRLWPGNYWEGAIGASDGRSLDRPYSPTDPVDSRLHRVDGTPALAEAPAIEMSRGLAGTVPGMRAASIVDTRPNCGLENPDRLAEAGFEELVEAHGCEGPRSSTP